MKRWLVCARSSRASLPRPSSYLRSSKRSSRMLFRTFKGISSGCVRYRTLLSCTRRSSCCEPGHRQIETHVKREVHASPSRSLTRTFIAHLVANAGTHILALAPQSSVQPNSSVVRPILTSQRRIALSEALAQRSSPHCRDRAEAPESVQASTRGRCNAISQPKKTAYPHSRSSFD